MGTIVLNKEYKRDKNTEKVKIKQKNKEGKNKSTRCSHSVPTILVDDFIRWHHIYSSLGVRRLYS